MNELKNADLELDGDRLRMLVVIASYGNKNLELLKRVILGYGQMTMDVDIAVVSNALKELGPNVEVVVGLPSRDPWSLPFAHKSILASNIDQYDLFIYSEDDIEITERNIEAFLRATPDLAPDEIAGFVRYEVDKTGARSLPDVHGCFHWIPESVKQRGGYVVGELSNAHAACYILTQGQLRRAIDSGGFLKSPYEGSYDLACTAATDPYTSCGFRKVVCISALEDFLIHHLSNRYAGKVGISLAACNELIQTQMSIVKGAHPASTLCAVESRMHNREWSKSYYEEPSAELLALVPNNAEGILSIGCGWGATEAELKKRGAMVTAVPLDSIIGGTAARLGIDVDYGTLAECLRRLNGRAFECVIITNLLHLLPNPGQVVEQCARLVHQGGMLVISGPNFGSLRVLAKKALGKADYRKLRAFEDGGIQVIAPDTLKGYLENAGLGVTAVQWSNHASKNGIEGKLGRYGATTWFLQAQR